MQNLKNTNQAHNQYPRMKLINLRILKEKQLKKLRGFKF